MRVIQGGYGQQNGVAVSGPAPSTTAKGSLRTGGAASSSAATSGEVVTISARASQLAEQSAAADGEKVNRLRSAVLDGTLNVDKQAIANQLVEGD